MASRHISTRDSIDLGWSLLPQVSRSFALCIKLLPHPLRDAVMMTYLLFRIADTIEDTVPEPAAIHREFQTFRRLLRGADDSEYASFGKELSVLTRDPAMQHLVLALPQLMAGFRSLPFEVQDMIRERLTEMLDGLRDYLEPSITTFEEQDRYCYFVAGTVGLLLTGLFKYYGYLNKERAQRLETAILPFGLGLQKVNIIKDFAHDRAVGKCFWPQSLFRDQDRAWKDVSAENGRGLEILSKMIDNAAEHLQLAFPYILTLPRTALRVRVFCLISYFMALGSLRLCRGNPQIFSPDATLKISRRSVYGIVLKSFCLSTSNWVLQCWQKRAMHDIL